MTETLTLSNKQASLPDDFLSIIDAKKGGSNNNDYLEQSSATFPADVDKQNMFYFTENTINLSTSDISSITISYYAVDTDDEGYPTNLNDFDKVDIDPDKIEKAITKNTCAIFAVNLFGNSCNFKRLKEIADNHNLLLIEDNCESFGATSDTGNYTGTIGELGTFSFFFSHHIVFSSFQDFFVFQIYLHFGYVVKHQTNQ